MEFLSFNPETGEVRVCAYQSYEDRVNQIPLSKFIDKTTAHPYYAFYVCEDHLAYDAMRKAESKPDEIVGHPLVGNEPHIIGDES